MYMVLVRGDGDDDDVLLGVSAARQELEDPSGEVGEGPAQVRLPVAPQHEQQTVGEEPGTSAPDRTHSLRLACHTEMGVRTWYVSTR